MPTTPAKPLPGRAYWRRLAPGLHVDDADYQQSVAKFALTSHERARLSSAFRADGFVALQRALLPWAVDLRLLRDATRRLVRRGWPASMLLVYDEVWAMAHQLSELVATLSGGCENSLDALAWSVTPSLGQSGFAPHRDRQPIDVPASFRADGTPRYCTVWIALSRASVDNSCLYLVPRGCDKGYSAGDDTSAVAEDPLLTLLRSDEAVQSVRACPLAPGGAVLFSHRAMHWGSRGRTDCAHARISLSFGHSDPAFEAPYLARARAQLPFPRPRVRVALAAAQLIAYHERFDLSLPLLRRLGATFRKCKSAFTKEYAAKVAAEFKSAVDDLSARSRRGGEEDEPGSDSSDTNEVEEAALDDALDAMLDAQMSAKNNLYDDYADVE